MSNSLNPKQKSSSFRFVRLSGGIIIAWGITLLLSYLINGGLFGSWIQMEKPPSGVKRIINARITELWFETQDGKFHHAWWGYGQFAEFNWFWSPPFDNISEIPKQENPLFRGNDCTKLHSSSFVQNPQATMVECIYAESQDSKSGSYYALTSDGNVLLWQETDGMISVLIFLCNIPIAIAAIISIIYFFIYIVARTKQNSDLTQHALGNL